jgi:predicted alpha/beta-fold hydrolase
VATTLEKSRLVEIVPIIESSFRPAWWCHNPHLQTMWPLAVKPAHPPLGRERIELPDGDFIDLDWTTNSTGPLVIVMHGLEGSAHSHYARRIMRALPAHGMRGVIMHFRGRSGQPNRLARAYHSGETGDINTIVNLLKERESEPLLAVIGYSLGGNVLLKWLGELGNQVPVRSAVAVSVPFVLSQLADHMSKGVARLYQRYLVKSLHRSFATKAAVVDLHLSVEEISELDSFWKFDDKVTAPIHGFKDAVDYYRQCSSRQYIKGIRVPTLVLHSRDDPFMTQAVIPGEDEITESVQLELSDHGGHVGFISGGTPWSPEYWLEPRIIRFLETLTSSGDGADIGKHAGIDN